MYHLRQPLRVIGSSNTNLLVGLTDPHSDPEVIEIITPNPLPISDTIKLGPLDEIQPKLWSSILIGLESTDQEIDLHQLKLSLAKTLGRVPILAGNLEYTDNRKFNLLSNNDQGLQVKLTNKGAWYCETSSNDSFDYLKYQRFNIEMLPSNILFSKAQQAITRSLDINNDHAPLFCVKVTKFIDGSIIMLIMFSNLIMDHVGMYSFLKTWSNFMTNNNSPTVFDARHLFYYQPSNNSIKSQQTFKPSVNNLNKSGDIKLIFFKFKFNERILLMKQEHQISIDDLFCAIIWKVLTKARHLSPTEMTRFQRSVDVRKFCDIPVNTICNGSYSVQTDNIQVQHLLSSSIPEIAKKLRSKLVQLTPEFIKDYIGAVSLTTYKPDALPYINFNFGTDLLCFSMAHMNLDGINFGATTVSIIPSLTTEGTLHILPNVHHQFTAQLAVNHEHVKQILQDSDLNHYGIRSFITPF